jgi:pyruvate formate lyase activating enzyme
MRVLENQKTSMRSVGEELARLTREGELYERLTENKVRCHACGHRCLILDGHDGVCRVRFNRGGTLQVPHGYVAALQCDPIEKKPFFHVLPGARAMSFGMLGGDYHCGYCQNWLTSQTLRDPASVAPVTLISPAEFCDLAEEYGADVVTSTYNEPLITSEWAVTIFREARRRGLHTSYVSNGNGTPEVIAYLKPWVDYYKVDLKGFDDKAYRQLGGKLETVLQTIETLVAEGFWVEVVTLIVPGFNDSDAELRSIAKFLAGVSRDIPWHCTAFHPDYKMQDRDSTTAQTLVRACAHGHDAGLRYCYAGNMPGMTPYLENTYCHGCGELLIERHGFHVTANRLTDAGACPKCHTNIPGRWRTR